MKLKFFTIPTLAGEESCEELNRFLSSHRSVSIEKQFVENGDLSHWTVCITYVEHESQAKDTRRQGRIDYRQVLSEGEFVVFAQLRNLRKEVAEREGIPVYAVLTNEQLAALVRKRVTSISAMAQIEGIGPARVEKYGSKFLAVLNREIPQLERENKPGETPQN